MSVEKVRTRRSYKKFSEFLDFIESEGIQKNRLGFLKKIHSTIDEVRGFGSETNSNYAMESIEQLAKDRGLV